MAPVFGRPPSIKHPGKRLGINMGIGASIFAAAKLNLRSRKMAACLQAMVNHVAERAHDWVKKGLARKQKLL